MKNPIHVMMYQDEWLITCLFIFIGSCGDPCGERVTSGELKARERGRAT